MLSEQEIDTRIIARRKIYDEERRVKQLRLKAFTNGFCPDCGEYGIKRKVSLFFSFSETMYRCLSCGSYEVLHDAYG